MESMPQNLEVSPGENKPKKDKSSIKKWLGAGVVAAAAMSAVGCDDKPAVENANDAHKQNQNDDWVGRRDVETDKKIESRADDLDGAKMLAAKKGIFVGSSDRVAHKEISGITVDVTVNGKSLPISESDFTAEEIKLIKISLDAAGQKYPPANWVKSTGEVKTNQSDLEEFLK